MGNSSASPSQHKDQRIPSLSALGFKIAPHKIQLIFSIAFLGTEIFLTLICPFKTTLSSPPSKINAPELFGQPQLASALGPPSYNHCLTPLQPPERRQSPSSPRTLSPEAVQALNSINAALEDMALTRYDPAKPIQLLIFNSSPTLVGSLYQPQGVLEWLHTPMGGAPQILNEVDALTSMIKNGRDRALQTLGKEPDILVTLFSLSDIQLLINNHSCFAISLIGFPGQIDNYYPDEK